MKNDFKVGDRVRVRQWDDMAMEFGVDEDGDICTPDIYFQKEMKDLCGKTKTIEGVDCDDETIFIMAEERCSFWVSFRAVGPHECIKPLFDKFEISFSDLMEV